MKLFEGFEIGQVLGAHSLEIGPQVMEGWEQLFPGSASGDELPPGFVAVVTMRSFTSVVAPRPPGNVHGSQRFELSRLPRVGERLDTRVTCVGKEVRRERRWVDFETQTTGEDGSTCFSGRMSIAWAA
jgi:hypothetical protein